LHLRGGAGDVPWSHDGLTFIPLPPRHALPLTGGALPSGTYVVRAEVTEAGGAVRILTQKLILTR